MAFVLASFGTLRASPGSAPALGAFFLLVAAVCYWGALSRFTTDEQNRNRRGVRVVRGSDAEFANSPYETKTATESAFAASWVKQFGNIEFLILVIGSVVFFTLLLVTGNTMAISVRERTGELAILKAIGFKDGSILLLVLAEALAIALLGGVLGLALAEVAIPALSNALNGMLPNLILSKSMLASGLGFALLVGAMSGLLPGIGAMRLRVVDALRRI